jgi:outer membrane protein TolC
MRFLNSINTRIIIIKLLIVNSLSLFAQSQDSVLTLKDFLKVVADNHPTVRQADLLNRSAQAELLAAQGGFDPKAYSDYENKFFDSRTYFKVFEAGVKVPTWYGIEVKGAYQNITGGQVNPDEKLPKAGQTVIGVSFPLLQNLMLDDRRADLFKARQTQSLNRADRAAWLNDFAMIATETYWKWAYAQQQRAIFGEALRVAEVRFRAIKSAYEAGDRMAMDTLESFIQVQDRQQQFNEAQLYFQEANLKLANFIWQNNQPKTLSNDLKSDDLAQNTEGGNFIQNRTQLLDNLSITHPILQTYQFKLAQLDIDQKLKQQKLLPKLNLNYNFLSNGGLAFENLIANNYKWGISFSTSTLFRAERGDVQLAKIKIENTQLMREQKALELQNKLRLAFNEVDNLQSQVNLYQQTLTNYQRLLQLENTRFELGESSLFLINSREMKWIESQVKLAKLLSEWQIAKASVDWAAGRLSF